MQCSQHADRYLVSAYRLSSASDNVAVGDLAAALGVSAASASAMTARLVEAGMLERDGRGIALTEKGRRRGAYLLRRHRLVECFLADVLHLPADRVHEEARRLEVAFSRGVVARLSKKLGAPTVCPHGHVIPGEPGGLPL